ncbi:unnamed protein product [Owenia fusiformis]|uniref:Uncharacterized protein n=1 Tax=Owenia fusiformis TaxID=6347 RepID=A0A8J1XMB1_OWEFU|nr:unnamed protein product [Owenia fusiformis]
MDYKKFGNDEGREDFQPVQINSSMYDVPLQEQQPIEGTKFNGQNAEFSSPVKFAETDKDLRKGNFIDPAGDRNDAVTPLEKFQLFIRKIVDHLGFRAFTVLLIIADTIIIIVDLATKSDGRTALEILSLTLSTYFVVETAARIFAVGFKNFFGDWSVDFMGSVKAKWLDLLDLVIVVVTFIISVVYTAADLSGGSAGFGKLIVAGRLIRLVRVFRLFMEKRNLEKSTRLVVSQNKRRFQKDGFDLDLCYVNDRCIAMSFPSSGIWALYRNPIGEVARFFDYYHEGQYRIYNLCSERTYDYDKFHNRVERVYIDDHNVPKVSEMISYASSVRLWLALDPKNIIAVHCKGGKGRTGTMICVYLLDSGELEAASDSLEYFGTRRTDLSVGRKFQGVETPSQSRYVGYFEVVKNKFNLKLPPNKPMRMKTLTINSIAGVGKGNGCDLRMELYHEKKKIFDCSFGPNWHCKSVHNAEKNCVVTEMDLETSPILVQDVKVMFHCSSSVPIGYEKCPFYFWFNTSFIEDNKLVLIREEIDNPHKEKTWETFKEDFSIEVTFEDANSNATS